MGIFNLKRSLSLMPLNLSRFNFTSFCFTAFSIVILSGCASTQNKLPTLEKVEKNSILARQASCEFFYQSLDNAASQENITDTQTTRLNNYPFLNINRFLLSFKTSGELETNEQKDFWLAEAAKLNRHKRKAEWINLSPTAQEHIKKKHLKSLTFNQRLISCSGEFLARLDSETKNKVIQEAQVSSDYSKGMRALGIYPLTSLFVEKKIKKHQASTRTTFDKKLHELKIKGHLQRYTPDLNDLQLIDAVNNSDSDYVNKENPLNIPFISSTTVNELFKRFAPTLEIDERGNFDKTGEMKLDKNGLPFVDTTTPIVYTMTSYTRFSGKTLLQLNYFFWFPERPSQTSSDIYAGKLDGIIWRVTLDENFEPLVFDSVHNCGCFHKFYSTEGVEFNLESALKEREPPFLAQHKLNKTDKHSPWVLRISSAEHFIERVYQKKQFDKDAKFYGIKSYHQLRHLSGIQSPPENTKSLFGSDGIIKISERSERFLLWPMGIKSAGAMRQWGHHATAFVGERYFDEPYLLDDFFKLTTNTEE